MQNLYRVVHVSNATRVPFQVLATSETTLVLFSSLDRVLENVEYVVMNYRPVLNGEHYLTGEEVCRRLCISKRTLQDYRDTGLLGYVQLPGKIIYRESEILDLLERYYRK